MELDLNALRPEREVTTERPGQDREVPVWELPDAPKGSTSGSLLVSERGKPVRVAGPTHYHALADGRVVAGYTGGTHHDDGKTVTRIVSIHEG